MSQAMGNNGPVPVQVLQATPGAVPASSLFGLPGVTNWSEQKENNDGVTVAQSSGSQNTANFPANFKQTDIVVNWQMEVSNSTTTTWSAGTPVRSSRFPYSYVGPIALNMQNQFNTINYPDGFHAAIMQAIRPSKFGYLPQFMDQASIANVNGTNQSNLTTSASAYALPTSGTAQVTSFTIDLVPSILFNIYYDLEEDGRLYSHKATPIKAWVSPQLMSGTNRVIQPQVTMNQIIGSQGDTAGLTNNGVTLTSASGTTTLGFRRKAIYQPSGQNDTPPVFNWQYSRDYRRFSLSALSSIDIPIPQVGQILSMALVMWDPTLGTGNVGGPLPLSSVKECDIVYGSGLFKYQDTPQRMQDRFYRQHNILMPEGVLVWDMGITDDGLITNAMALNTLTTSGCTLHVDFTSQTNSGAYGILLFESLRYVSVG
jgi:hypothetical protein